MRKLMHAPRNLNKRARPLPLATQGAGVRISTDTAHQLHLMVQALGELQQ